MVDSLAIKEIDKISYELLKHCKALDVYPTPIDKIVQFSELNVDQNINLSANNFDFLFQMSESFKSAMGKIRGMLDREKKLIYLDLNQNINRQNFIKLHEVGHEVLPWQKKILKYLDDDKTLDADYKEAFEAEASYFASTTLFQQDRFLSKMKGLPLSMETPIYLAKTFGASNHAAIRRYVEHSKCRCALLVLENISPKGLVPTCEIRNYFQSHNFTKVYGNLTWKENIGFKWPFVQDYYFKRRFKKDGYFTRNTENGEVEFHYHFFNSTYNAFVLIFPNGEGKNSKVEFIISK